jgi:hypothetical protein
MSATTVNNTPSTIEAVGNVQHLMDRFFGPNYCLLSNFLIKTKGVIAGGAALWIASPYCKVEDYKGDIDIWIQDAPGVVRNHSYGTVKSYKGYKKECYESRERALLSEYVTFTMEKMGLVRNLTGVYQETIKEYTTDVDKNFKFINTIHTYCPKANAIKCPKKVQIIYTNISPVEVVNKFDLSICQTYWEGMTTMELFENSTPVVKTFYPDHIKDKKFYNFSPESKNREVRENKYIKRGFRLLADILIKENDEIENKEHKLSDALIAFLRLTPNKTYSTKMVTKLICNYINTHHLQDPKDTECILCDGPMFDLFNIEEFKFNDLQKLVNAQLLA